MSDAVGLGAKPANTVISAIKEIAEFVRHRDDQAQASALRTAVREALMRIIAAADVLAAVLEDKERSNARKLCHSSDSPIHPSAASRLRAPGSADAAGWGGPSPESFETVNDKGLKVTLTMKYPRTVVERGRTLRASVEQWSSCQMYAGHLADIPSILEGLEFLVRMGTLGKLTTMAPHEEKPSGSILIPPDLHFRQTLQDLLEDIRAHYVPRGADLTTSRGISALSFGIRARVNYYLQPHQGSDRLTDALGALGGRPFCAIAATDLFEVFRGRKPGHSNPNVKRLCALIWKLAGGPIMPGQEGEDNNDDAWERHLRGTRKGRVASLLESRLLVSDILLRNGVVREEPRSD